MKVQPYQTTIRKTYPTLARVVVLVAVSCAVGACQQRHARFIGEAPRSVFPEKIAVSQASQDAKDSVRAHESYRPNIASAKGKPAMTGKERVAPQTPVQGD